MALDTIPHIRSAVKQVVSGMDDCLYVADMDAMPDAAGEADQQHLTIRDYIRSAFAEYGVEIEFSGKLQNERGVVIDIDEERFAQTNPDVNTLRFGQTVVRVKG